MDAVLSRVPGLERHTASDIRGALRARDKAHPKGADGKRLRPFRHVDYVVERALELCRQIEHGRGGAIVQSYARTECADEPWGAACVWCGKHYSRRDDEPICYPCRLRESADRAVAAGDHAKAKKALAYAASIRQADPVDQVDEEDADP